MMYDDCPDDYVHISFHLSRTAQQIFKSYADLKRLRESSGLRTRTTPHWATYRDFSRGVHATWGTGAEALALVLFYLADTEKLSAAAIDRYRDAAEYFWRKVNEGDVDDPDDLMWHKEGDHYVGNPATAPVVFRALNLAYDIEERRKATGESSTPAQEAQRLCRERDRRAAQPPPYLD
ncbi:unnamed protein product [Peniophora sp. CBMAI 1063]|nr:unnamed protein product [Peniophora sp. CBMAI 1063]